MNREDIIRMAQEAGFGGGGFVMPTHAGHITHELERFAALIASAEREACAKWCETLTFIDGTGTAEAFADEVRNRGQA
jgi:hypothetical protein